MKIKYFKEIARDQQIDEKKIIKLLLENRKITDIKDFLNPKNPIEISLSDFGAYQKQINQTLKLLTQFYHDQKMIVVYTDYDADGITGGAILWETLYLLGFKVMPYVPDRKKEGYGFSILGIDNVINRFNPALIVSVDHGITKVKEVAYAKKKGIKVIITDHHLKQETTPKADAIFHIPKLSGAGVAYFVAKEIFNKFKTQSPNFKINNRAVEQLNNYFSVDYLSLAAIGTVADLVPLIGPSRSLVKYGLETFSKVNRFGIKHILKEAGIEGKTITPYEIGFIIAPRINAVGRLENAIDGLRLLCTTKEDRAYQLAHRIGTKNRERQDLVEKSVAEAIRNLGERGKKQRLIILTSDHWHEGIIGLIASKIAEQFYRPTIVITKTDAVYKGSARSIPGFHITNFLRGLKKYLIDIGGHNQAAGFTIATNQLTKFITTANKLANKYLKNKDLEKNIAADLKLPISKITLTLVKALETLAPFGIANPRPTFYSQGQLISARSFGKANNHLKLYVKDPNNQSPITNCQTLEMVSFNNPSPLPSLSPGQLLNIIYTLEIDSWGGKEKIRGKCVLL